MKCVAIDTETTGLSPWNGDRMFACAAVFPGGRTKPQGTQKGTFKLPRTSKFWYRDFDGLREILEDTSIDKVFHNAKFDIRMLRYNGFKVRGQVWDTMILCHLLDGRDSKGRLNLDACSQKYIPSASRKVVKEITDWFEAHGVPKGKRGNFADLPRYIVERRCIGDADLTLQLFLRIFPTVKTTFPYLLEQEHKLLPIVGQMEDRGLIVDEERIHKLIEEYDEVYDDTLEWLSAQSGIEEFNLGSHKHLEYLFKQCGILDAIEDRTKPSKTYPQGQPSFAVGSLNKLHHPTSAMVLLGRLAKTTPTNFLRPMLALRDPDGVLHPNFHQTGTTTGRFSSSGPNLQNFPQEDGRRSGLTQEEHDEWVALTGWTPKLHVRSCVLMRPGHVWLHADKSQAEVVMLAHYTKDPTLVAIVNSGKSVHKELCKHLFNDLTPGLLRRTKGVVFGFQYGIGMKALASMLNDSIAHATSVKNKLAKALPGLPKWQRELAHQIDSRGYVETIHSRRHYLRNSEHYMAVNRMCQGTVSDEIKFCMVAIDDYLTSEGIPGTVLLNIHDDIVTELPEEYLEVAGPEIHRIMCTTSMPYNVPLPASLKVARDNWDNTEEVNYAKTKENSKGLSIGTNIRTKRFLLPKASGGATTQVRPPKKRKRKTSYI